VTLNGKPLERSWLSHAEIVAGGKLVMTMGPIPNKFFGTSPAARVAPLTAQSSD
jgi:putative alpha-1,2-mannosidase